MNLNTAYYNVSDALPDLLKRVLAGDEVGSRQGDRNMELTHVGIKLFRPWQREVIVPGRKANIAAQIAETMWVLAGRNDVEFLSHYLPRAEQFSDDGEVWRGGYGPRLRKWGAGSPGETNPAYFTDQLAEVVKLLKETPGTRRAVMSIFDPASDYQDSKDIPCNNWLSFICRKGKLDLHVGIRSNDVMWGWNGINQFEWSVLQEIVAGLVGVEVGALHFSATSFHLYERHWSTADKIVKDDPYDLHGVSDSPRFEAGGRSVDQFDELLDRWFRVEYDIRTGSPLVHHYVDEFPEPMMKSWLRVLQWWWSNGDRSYLEPLQGTRLDFATRIGMQPKKPDTQIIGVAVEGAELGQLVSVATHGQVTVKNGSDFIEFATQLHSQKHAAYGDSWKKRGEMLGIMANIARKIDRLGGAATEDETSADTAMDLMVYLAKYQTWLSDPHRSSPDRKGDSDYPNAANWILRELDQSVDPSIHSREAVEAGLRTSFDRLERLVTDKESREDVPAQVRAMTADAYRLARHLWDSEQEQKIRLKQEANALENSKRRWDPEAPHSRACGVTQHPHGVRCSNDCPTCSGGVLAS